MSQGKWSHDPRFLPGNHPTGRRRPSRLPASQGRHEGPPSPESHPERPEPVKDGVRPRRASRRKKEAKE